MKKRILALLLTAALLASMVVMPASAVEITASENVTETGDTCPCGCGKALSAVSWKPYSGNVTTGHYYLEADYVQDGERIVVAGEKVVLDLRGNTITTMGNTRLLLVNGYLAVIDTVGGGRLSAKADTASTGGVVQVVDNEIPGALFELYSGTITLDAAAGRGKSGGLVYVGSGATFRMHDGLLLNGKSNGYGGCIGSLESNSTLEVLGGSIIGGKADANWTSGGNIYFEGTVTLKDCRIIGGSTTGNGGNIATTGNTITIENCVISDGYADGTSARANGVGGNIYLQTNVKLNITDSIVRNGYAVTAGGNIYFGNGKTAKNFIRTQVYGGISEGGGANLYNSAGAVITLTDSTIDSGVYNSTGTVTLKGTSSIGLTEGDCPCCAERTWYDYGSAEGNHWKLSADNAAFGGLTVTDGQTVVLDLAGFDLTAAGRAFTVAAGGTLILLDSVGGGIVTGSGIAGEAGGVISNEGTLKIYGGKYVYTKNADIAVSGGGVIVNRGTLNIHGGIFDGSAYSNTATTSFGGAIYQANGTADAVIPFTMSGGKIVGGNAYKGGSLYVGNYGDVTITSGMIMGGTAYANGGNIYGYGGPYNCDYKFRVTGCAVLDGKVSNDKAIVGWGGNLEVDRYELTLNDCYIRGGKVEKSTDGYGGNIHAGSFSVIRATNTIIEGGNSCTAGGNIYMSNQYVDVKLTDCLVTKGTCNTRGGNIQASNGVLTVIGGEISYGTAGLTGGNIHSNTDKNAGTTLQADAAGNVPQIYGGVAGETGGNIYVKGPATLNAAFVNGGTAGVRGGDVYVAKNDKTDVEFGADFRGDIALGVDTGLFASENIYGGAINQITTKATDATFYLDGSFNNCGTLVQDNTLYLTVAAVVAADGTMQWYISNAEAVAACGDGSYVKLYTDSDLELTKDLYVDLNGKTVAVSGAYAFHGMDSSGDGYAEPAGSVTGINAQTYDVIDGPNGNRYVAIRAEDGAVTYHRLGMQITGVNIRPNKAGMYYTAKWSCDDTLKGLVSTYGIVTSLDDMPDANFAADATNLWTELGQENFQSGVAQNGALIQNILLEEGQTDAEGNLITPEKNSEYGKSPVYAKAYLTFENGPTLVGAEDIQFSLYQLMQALDKLIVEKPAQYRRHNLTARNFYETWKENGMGSWKLSKIPTPTDDGVINVLMIGNSHCYYYVEELYELAKAAGIDMRVCNLYYSGCPLVKHYNWWLNSEPAYQFYETYTDGRTGTSNASLEWALAQYEWDVISIQEYGVHTSADPATHFASTATYHENLLPYLKAQFPNAKMLWHQTWGYQFNGDNGDYTYSAKSSVQNLYTQQKEFAQLICEEYDYQRVPSGEAWENVRTDNGYNYLCVRLGNNDNWGDGYHDGNIGGGQYLNACVWFEVITGQSVVGNTYRPAYKNGTISSKITANLQVNHDGTYYRLNEDFVLQLQNAAHKAVAEMNQTAE